MQSPNRCRFPRNKDHSQCAEMRDQNRDLGVGVCLCMCLFVFMFVSVRAQKASPIGHRRRRPPEGEMHRAVSRTTTTDRPTDIINDGHVNNRFVSRSEIPCAVIIDYASRCIFVR